ncbi:GNAT family N-acetyltransferase [Sulfitobacter sp. M57]|uniref:GNAT family N-acetyltransferase n=1 Tax=unclassified Sulfitobacter TaxID=196795 RepID=UPI0023E1F526|nr:MULTISPECIES: GNAT family N-acetyltransferase [unclassified Sulfitobacter]MDF3416088.1 GNAT family N-acetyltransferase [Sulfitobacter sp. KE5]MDF3423567.1 GNAT family N-acetyltransferase [Sulfitobacter sp. KE43]MDF3434631.1 GNAT family N-acetyltransferase [Sulfitobacter sp. KE42]MDF3460273.1 GNAT family N-acetyltransferase [Sulfitobacter sp. S74]MDF3464169.1 GNAT family N-acetyltransferase [Sulfitobacter sp. Ks18]
MEMIKTIDPRVMIRQASGEDAAAVLGYMRKLGAYQKMSEAITATEPEIKRLLDENLGAAIFGYYDAQIVSFAFYHRKASAFSGRSGLYIDAFLVDAEIRHIGLGKILMGYLCRLALDQGDQFLEWGCLDWNTPAIEFYKNLGAYSVDDMTIYRFRPEHLQAGALLFEPAR